MENIRPCPYCGGEVEVVRLKDKITDKKIHEKQYRIWCLRCKQSVGRGIKFPDEKDEDGAERIKQYEAVIDAYYSKGV